MSTTEMAYIQVTWYRLLKSLNPVIKIIFKKSHWLFFWWAYKEKAIVLEPLEKNTALKQYVVFYDKVLQHLYL